MPTTEVRRAIAASPERVWAILTNAPVLAGNGLGITRIDGTIAPGGRISLWTEAAPKRPFALAVTGFDPPREMVWTGGMPLGLFRGVRRFTLTPTAAGCEFHMREDFTGPLAPLICRAMPDLNPGFRQFAEGLARIAEG